MGKGKEISQWRSEVIEKFINLEWLINSIISQKYLKACSYPFLFDFLYDVNCTFALKRNVLFKISPDFPEKDNLNRLNNIRNLFAHCNQELFRNISNAPPSDAIGVIPNPKNPERDICFKQLHEEFNTKEPAVARALLEIYYSLGGQLLPVPDSKN
ncbi:MAG: hypothetical protein K9M51_01595 [Candidatus Gracilibacteria bacterium]|nr:hypothetical protein [Candidatus Gracilibacteria bacterium]